MNKEQTPDQQQQAESQPSAQQQPATDLSGNNQKLQEQEGSLKNNDHDIDPEHPQESSLSHR